ncbi:histone-lysine N-methyltransferase SETMAR [Trichonephila clavata]|uniref:Histone-lysine N-methyltransferase SETMAR n=1 Tax=Trichonephila clavata TaxID=2740835 RepID=A0A8X6JKP6_TRICU|nr:histone-lysine N-methyltransferase SETMAR [Trichonephila clavata]
MIRANRRITIDEVAEELGISHERAQNIIHDILRYRKVSARWLPRQLTSTHQEQRMAVSLEHLFVDADANCTQAFTPEGLGKCTKDQELYRNEETRLIVMYIE